MIIPEMLADLMAARKTLALVSERKVAAYKIFQDNIVGLLSVVAEASDQVTRLEADIKSDVLAEYAQMGNKTPYPGVQVKEMTRLDYESSKALEWAKRTGVALLLNTKTFETLVKADPEEFPFVEIFKVPQVQIAQDLEKVLG